MLINTINGSQYEAHNIAWMKAKPLSSGGWELEIHPAQGSLLEPAGASFAEVAVPQDEAARIARVARHLFASGAARAIDGERQPYRLTANEQRRIAEAERVEELFRLQKQAEQEPADPLERGLAALDRLAADGQAWDAEPVQGAAAASSGRLPLEPGDDPARHGQVVREGGKHYRL